MSREQRRSQLLRHARRAFARRGYHAASIEDIITSAGVARGTFYNYFDSKRAVFQVVLEELFDLVWGSIAPISTAPGEDVHAQVAGNIASLCRAVEGDSEAARIVFTEAVGLDAEADAALAYFYGRSRDRLTRALCEGQDLGIIGDIDPDVAGLALLGMVKEYWFQQALGAEVPDMATFLTSVYRLLTAGLLLPRRGV